MSEQPTKEQIVFESLAGFKATFEIDGDGDLYIEVRDCEGRRGMYLDPGQIDDLIEFLKRVP